MFLVSELIVLIPTKENEFSINCSPGGSHGVVRSVNVGVYSRTCHISIVGHETVEQCSSCHLCADTGKKIGSLFTISPMMRERCRL